MRLSHPVRFIVVLGVVSLFADMTYEGARSITGPFLGILGASGTAVGIISGAGELIGYSLRLLSGYVSDRTRRYWTVTFAGYVINLAAVPLLALAGSWHVAGFLIVLERFGKAIRTPPRDAILSDVTQQTGHGRGFGLHEALDQIGAVAGPLLIAVILRKDPQYGNAFAWLALPAGLALISLILAYRMHPATGQLESMKAVPHRRGFTNHYWIFCFSAACFAFGYADFPLIAFHLETETVPVSIPLLYATAMAVDAIAALVFGYFYDRKGVIVLAPAFMLSAFFAPLLFFNVSAWAGAIFWGIGMGAQESVLRASVADLVPPEKRGSAYGMFHMIFGVAWFLGSALMGYLYDRSIPALVLVSVCLQVAAIPLLFQIQRKDVSNATGSD